ncbi:MAG: sulfite exporter TauE/SafE family protein [Cytophagales bacterium]|nr:MAG: sulfite exporter TauE/SafE family protein [Cytophagales bacterium]
MANEWYIYLLAILTGALAGFINTLTGSGSLVTLAMLMFAGLPANYANATNRLGVLTQSTVAVATFYRNGKLNYKSSAWFVVPSVIGAVVGTQLAVNVSAEFIDNAIGAIMVVMLFVILVKPERWLKAESETTNSNKILTTIVFFAVGFYAGFLQAGVGILLHVAFVLGAKYSIKDAVSLKTFLVFLFTIPSLFIFIWSGQVVWDLAILLAVGQSIGAWTAAHFAMKHPSASVWTYRMLVAVVIFSIVHIFFLK